MTQGEAVRAAHRRHVDLWDAWAKADAAREDSSIVMKPTDVDFRALNGGNFIGADPPMATVEAW